MSFRILNQAPQYFTRDGQVLAGGSLTFSQSGTATPADTYANAGLTVTNPNPVPLDSSGRSTVDIWGNIAYRAVLKDSTGAVIWTEDNVQASSDVADQTGNNGKFLTTNGTITSWTTVIQLPSQTGNAGKYLTTDGTNPSWAATSAISNGGGGDLTNWVLVNVRDEVQTITAAATLTLDFTLGAIILLNQAVDVTTLTIAGVTGATLTIHRVKDATGTSRALTWPTNVKWPGGTAPTPTQTTGAHDVFALQCVDGTNWIGSSALNIS